MSKKNHITEEKKMRLVELLARRSNEKSLDTLLDSGILADMADTRADLSFGSRSVLRSIIGLPEIMEVDYDLSFEDMMIRANIPKISVDKVMKKLGSTKVVFDYSGKVVFEYENVGFAQPISTTLALDRIDKLDSEWTWHPFCVAQLLSYIQLHPERFYSNFVVALGKIIDIDGIPHVFAVGTVKKKPDLDLVPANGHKWKKEFNFPKCRLV